MSDDPADSVSETTRQVLDELDPGTVIEDKVILSQRQAAVIMAGGATLAGVLGVGVGGASGQSGGKFGTASNPLNADLANYGYTSTADGADIEIEGETFQINQ